MSAEVETTALVAREARPLTGAPGDHDELLEMVGDAEVVLLGEASHGTHEFYRQRAVITKRLIEEKGFTAVAVEADWPDAYRVNRYVKGATDDAEAFEGREYARSGERFSLLPYVAKTGKRTYCLAPTEEAMKDLLRQLDREEKAELNEDLERALDYVSGKDHYFAAADVNSEMAAVAGGISVRSSVKAKGIAIFKKERDAEEAHAA